MNDNLRGSFLRDSVSPERFEFRAVLNESRDRWPSVYWIKRRKLCVIIFFSLFWFSGSSYLRNKARESHQEYFLHHAMPRGIFCFCDNNFLKIIITFSPSNNLFSFDESVHPLKLFLRRAGNERKTEIKISYALSRRGADNTAEVSLFNFFFVSRRKNCQQLAARRLYEILIDHTRRKLALERKCDFAGWCRAEPSSKNFTIPKQGRSAKGGKRFTATSATSATRPFDSIYRVKCN